MTGVFNTIKDALPNFEDEQLDNFGNAQTTTTQKPAKTFLLPDFFTSSNVTTPVTSPLMERPGNHTIQSKKLNEREARKVGFGFAPCEIEVRLLLHD